jgi:chemotaxis family two-component system sensor kinase Cph1
VSEIVVNLENCAREPIHIPGAIQPHGLIFILREPDLKILQVSENVSRLLDTPPDRLLDKNLSSFLNDDQIEKVRFALNSVDPRDNNPVDLQLKTSPAEGSLDGFVHRHDGLSYLELEPASMATRANFLEFYKLVAKLTDRLYAATPLAALLDGAVTGIREMTGFDRVVIYRFADSHEGEVIAEARVEEVDSYIGLWYPASDIPEQARRLYTLNPIRNVVDVDYTPALIVPAINPETHSPADLSFAALRSVSPIHCEYLKNMGVAASMSISIMREDRLWGLVACHHRSPRYVPYEIRKACTFIAQVLSGEIARREVEAESAYHSRATMTEARFLELMAGSPNPLLALVSSSPNLLDLIPADGAAVIKADRAHMIGHTPNYDEVMEITRLLRSANLPSSFVTRSLENHFPMTASMRATASGIIALEIAREPATYVLFFRPEVAQTVLWGGNPEKPVVATDNSFRLSPRKSFETWKEEVRGQALPWSKTEVRVAHELRKLIAVVSYGK